RLRDHRDGLRPGVRAGRRLRAGLPRQRVRQRVHLRERGDQPERSVAVPDRLRRQAARCEHLRLRAHPDAPLRERGLHALTLLASRRAFPDPEAMRLILACLLLASCGTPSSLPPGGDGAGGDGSTPGCSSDGQCSGATPRCDKNSGLCVACLPTLDNCPKGEKCVMTNGTWSCSATCQSST